MRTVPLTVPPATPTKSDSAATSDCCAVGSTTIVTARPCREVPSRLGATVFAKSSVNALPLFSPLICACSDDLVARSFLTCWTSVLSTSPLSGPPPSATPMASARNTETIETMW